MSHAIDKVLAAVIGRALKAATDEMSLAMEKTTVSEAPIPTHTA